MENNQQRYAHSLPNTPCDKWQPLDRHLADTAERASEFAKPFGSADWAHHAAWLHDLGKADAAFQGYLLRENGLDDADYDVGRVNHSSAGASLAVEQFGPYAGRLLAYLVAGHHAGLPDWYTSETGNAALPVRLQEGAENLERIRRYAMEMLEQIANKLQPPAFLAKNPENFHVWMRMLYSCLVDADFLDTEAFMQPGLPGMRMGFKPLADLKPTFDRFMVSKTLDALKTPVNAIRQEILAACRAAAQQSPGIFSLTVPTGGGKTLSGMAFALDHAIKYHKRRIIYVIPYTSIIEQTAKTLADIFGAENVVEHHSNLDPDKETQRSRLASENWDAPIIVTTNVQFFESLYAAKSSRCRKLHNLCDSVVLLDEAQLLPPGLIKPCVAAMNQLVRHYGVTMVLSTATQPALPGLVAPVEIIPRHLELYARLKRTALHLPPDINKPVDWPTLAEQLKQYDRVLCIVNARRDCYDLFKLMPPGTIHLSALMCGAHRTRIIRYIKWRLKKGKPLRVISTQLVEAGVDIDFPVVYRAFAGLDSISQAAGRCNREGRLNADGQTGQVHVFVPPKPAQPGLLRKGEDTSRELLACGCLDLHSPDLFTRYFTLFYSKVNDTGTKFYEWLVKDVNPTLAFQFRTAAANFKLIDDKAQRPVLVRYGKNDALLKQLRFTGPSRDLMRRLQRYTVNLSVRTAEQLKTDGLLEVIHDGILVQTMPNAYRNDIGLDVFRESLPVEDTII